jgi:hypothetical protein
VFRAYKRAPSQSKPKAHQKSVSGPMAHGPRTCPLRQVLLVFTQFGRVTLNEHFFTASDCWAAVADRLRSSRR